MTKKYPLLLLAVWTLPVAVSFFLNVYENRKDTLRNALLEARIYVELNAAYREWASDVGGLYVSVDKVSPNPYLSVQDRDIKINGRGYTLVNPAYMTRMVFEKIAEKSDSPVANRITSLKPLNPISMPDAWEKRALLSFESGQKEASSVTTIGGKPYFRLMRPFITGKPCLKCHGKQGYREGDIRGGISISIPLSPALGVQATIEKNIIITHFMLWLLGSIGLVAFSRSSLKQQQQIVESEWKFRTLSESSNDWEYWVTDDRKIFFISPSCRDVTGYGPEEFRADPLLTEKIILGDDRELWKGHRSNFRANTHHEIEYRIITKDGKVKWLSHVCGPIYEKDRFMGRRASNRDITQRKEIEAALSRQLNTTEAFFANAITPLVFLDRDFNFMRVNAAYARACQRDMSEFPGHNHFEFYPSEELREKFEEVVRTGLPYQAYARPFTFPDHPEWGATYWDLTLVPILDNTGTVDFLVFSLLDVTDRKLAEEALMKLSHAIEQSPVSVVITDREGNIEFTNPKFTEMTGYAPEEAKGKNPRILKSGQTPQEVYKDLWATITSGGVWHGELRNRKKSGELFWEAAHISPIRNRNGEITHFVAIKEDITAQRMLEGQLRQAQKMEAIGQLAGGIAHDFNNILSAIVGYGALLDMKLRGEDPLRLYVKEILASTERATKLTHSLLAFSRKQVMLHSPVDLNTLVSRFESFLVRIIGEDIQLRTNLLSEELIISADVGQIEQLLMNLATNARDAMPRGGTLLIETGKFELDNDFISAHGYGRIGRFALISFSDTGAGMSEETRKRIFEPFFTTKEIGKGTGLGLAITYGIVKQHDGFINVYSEPEKGTTFSVYLPLTDAKAEVSPAIAVSAAPLEGNETILVAEDDERVRNLAGIVLKEYGYNVITAVDGMEAVIKFSENKEKIQLLLLDMIMPRKSGKEAYEEIRMIKPGIKVLFTSGYTANKMQIDEFHEEGMDFILKPVSPRDMLKKVREVLDKNNGPAGKKANRPE